MENYEKLPQFGSMPKKAISWRAVFGGLVTVFAIMLVLNLIGIAIGFSTIEPTEEGDSFSGLGTGAVIWWILTNLIAIFAGAFVAARAGVSFSDKGGIIQGFLTWALYCVVSYLLVASAIGSVISGVGNMVMKTASATGEALFNKNSQNNGQGIQLGNIDWQKAKSEFYALLEDTEKEALDPEQLESQAEEVTTAAKNRARNAARDPGEIDREINSVFDKAENEFGKSLEALDREALVNVIVNRSDLTRKEANEVVDNYIETYKEVKSEVKAFVETAKEEISEQAKIAAEATAEAISKAAMYLAITLVLGIIIGVFGGIVGVRSLRSDYNDQLEYREKDQRTII